jgi:branched-subunit amino acid permease
MYFCHHFFQGRNSQKVSALVYALYNKHFLTFSIVFSISAQEEILKKSSALVYAIYKAAVKLTFESLWSSEAGRRGQQAEEEEEEPV